MNDSKKVNGRRVCDGALASKLEFSRNVHIMPGGLPLLVSNLKEFS